jgi:hypothetical protein
MKERSAIKLMVDGKTFSQSVTIGSISNSDPLVLGAHPGSEFFKGTLDEASIEFN